MNWEEFDKEIKVLCKKINYSPDIVIGIARGGIIPSFLISKYLKVKDLHSITVKKINNDRKVTSKITEDVKGKNILLVEDMLETGKSLIVAKKYLKEKGTNVKTACLYTMPISEIKPDYFLRKVREVVKFPWE